MMSYKRSLKPNAQALRREMTPEEKHLWYDFLKKLPVTVNRQKVIGGFIVDFYISSARLAIEIDGRQHLMAEHIESDKARDAQLLERGIRVFRCSNDDINKRFKTVCDMLLDILEIKASEVDFS